MTIFASGHSGEIFLQMLYFFRKPLRDPTGYANMTQEFVMQR